MIFVSCLIHPLWYHYSQYFLSLSPSIFDVSTVLANQVVPLLLAWVFTFLLVLGGPRVFGWVGDHFRGIFSRVFLWYTYRVPTAQGKPGKRPKKSLSEKKYREFGNVAKTKGIWFAQVVNSLILNVKDIFIFVAIFVV